MVNIFKVKEKIRIIPLILLTILPLLGGLVVGYLNRNSMNIYNNIKLPSFAPPGYVFPIVWSILYILMGFASYRIYMYRDTEEDIGNSLFIYIVQLLFNYLWSFIFFSFRLYGVAFIELVILFILVVITCIKFIKLDKLAGALLIPYLVWLIYAGVLNFLVWMYNEM